MVERIETGPGGSRRVEREGRTTGRWPRYNLIVDGVDVGEVRRTMDPGGDRMTPHMRYDAWNIGGVTVETRAEAEARLIARAVRFGYLPAEAR